LLDPATLASYVFAMRNAWNHSVTTTTTCRGGPWAGAMR